MLEHEKEAERANNPPKNKDSQRKAFDWTTFKANTADEEIQKANRGVTYPVSKDWTTIPDPNDVNNPLNFVGAGRGYRDN
jgi:hypothetical protein